MNWKPFAWFCIALLAFVIVAGPTTWGIIQKNRQLTATLQSQSDKLVELRDELDGTNQRFDSEVTRSVAQARRPLEQQLAETLARLESLQSKTTELSARDSFEREMQENLAAALSRIKDLEQQATSTNDDQEEVDLRARIAVLRTRHDQTEARLDELKASDLSEWETLKNDLRESWSHLSASLEKGSAYDAIARTGRLR